MANIEITEKWQSVDFTQVINLYSAVGWTTYSENPAELKLAIGSSSKVFIAIENDKLVGLIRSLSDNVAIHYLQDILVEPTSHRKGIGKKLLESMLDHYKNVRTHMLLTDDEDKQRKFYESFGYKNIAGLTKYKLNAYVQMKGLNLE